MNEPTQPIQFYEELLERLQPRLSGYILSLTASPSDVDDIRQETNHVLLSKMGDFKQPGNFDAWAFKIAYFQSLSFLQKRSRSKLAFNETLLKTIADEYATPDNEIEKRINHLERCLSQLQDRTRSIVNEYYFHNRSINEIAGSFSLKPNHVAQVLYRARKALFKCIIETETNRHE